MVVFCEAEKFVKDLGGFDGASAIATKCFREEVSEAAVLGDIGGKVGSDLVAKEAFEEFYGKVFVGYAFDGFEEVGGEDGDVRGR